MKKKIAIIAAIIIASPMLYSFCGFYVSKADATLKNKTSQVILVRDGNRNVITMYNDYKGDTKDFAMVVPVPVTLQKSDVKVVYDNLIKDLKLKARKTPLLAGELVNAVQGGACASMNRIIGRNLNQRPGTERIVSRLNRDFGASGHADSRDDGDSDHHAHADSALHRAVHLHRGGRP